MPTVETITSFYDGYLSHLDKFNERHRFVFNTFDTMGLKGKSVLDIGCGTGITSRHLADKAKEVVAVDLSSVLIEHALLFNSRPNIRYFVSDITEWKWSSKFDVICMVDILEHIPEERITALMNSVKNLCHDGTEIYLNIPTGDILRYLHGNRPELLQIVDIPHDDVLELFKMIGYLPAYYKLYWQQYVEYIFRTETYMTTTFDSIFKKE